MPKNAEMLAKCQYDIISCMISIVKLQKELKAITKRLDKLEHAAKL